MIEQQPSAEQPSWRQRLKPLGRALLNAAGGYGCILVSSRLQPDLYGNQNPIDIEVAQFAANIPGYFVATDWYDQN